MKLLQYVLTLIILKNEHGCSNPDPENQIKEKKPPASLME